MAYEYYWLRNYVALQSEPQIKRDLEKRTAVFNFLGSEGWELLPTMSGEHHFCFRRTRSSLTKVRYEYYWLRDFISLLSDTQIQQDMNKRSKLFNELSAHNWELMMDDLSMFCFMRVKK